ncbi:MAG: PPC domain-containing protein [Gemmataceae bacterium]
MGNAIRNGWIAVIIASCLCAETGIGQDKKKDAKKPPAIKMTLPLALQPGSTITATLRGHGLAEASEVRFPGGQATVVKFASKGQAGVPDKNPERVGDTQVVVELKVKDKLPTEPIPVVVVTPNGNTEPFLMLIADLALPIVKEKEPNEGFRNPQTIPVPCVVEGTIERQRDVDVFRFEGKKGQKIVAEVVSARQGSGLDAQLTLFDKSGNQLAFSDDAVGQDPWIELMLPEDGEYLLSLIDAHDTGSNLHAYRLIVTNAKKD